MKINTLPTGYLFTDNYSRGELETLSIGDYGKKHNVKADFLGLTRPLCGVPNTECAPLQEKWVITVSTQYGCPQRCVFCDVPKIKFNGNASFGDIKAQVYSAVSLFPYVRYTERMNLHFARMGEPIFNPAVFEFAKWAIRSKKEFQDETGLRVETFHPVLTTSLPKHFKGLREALEDWCRIKNFSYKGQAGLQFSVNSTSEEQRDEMFAGRSITLEELSCIAKRLPPPLGRKYCLNFALASGYEVDAGKLRRLFDPEKFMVKITPIHNNDACREHGIETVGGYEGYAPYQRAEEDLRGVDFDVLVFVPSMDEEDGLVTCGNLVLSGGEVKTCATAPGIAGV